ncbi:MAG: amidohydrolase family protein, partial [Actinobacteria bacterium]|nr:amidohydrolase family protein [Actinomycetota bacterium]
SAASNPRMDIFDEMRAVRDEVARQSEGTLTVTSAELLRMATVEAAEMLGLGADIGSLTPGKLADMVALSIPEGFENSAANVLEWARRENVVATILGGRLAYHASNIGRLQLSKT